LKEKTIIIYRLLLIGTLPPFPVVSNDDLYGSDPKFINEINSLCSQITDLVLIQLKYFGVTHQLRLQGVLTLDLFIRVISSADLQSEKTFTLAINLWNLAVKNRQSMDSKVFVSFYITVANVCAANVGSLSDKNCR
jgi:hypothetical protein